MSYETTRARDQFDLWSRWYDLDLLQLFFFHPTHRMLLEYLEPTDRQILDVGCGTGSFAARLLTARPEVHVWGVDLSAGMLRRSSRRAVTSSSQFQPVQADSERLPFADSRFDVVTCAHSFHHYPHQAAVLAEMHRVLRPGGRLLLVDGDRDRLWGRLLFEGLVVFLEGAVHHMKSRSLRQLFRETGFVGVEQHRRRGPLPFLLTIGRAVKAQPSRRAA
jgi:ubiquinone/menaquinone biosynthesis C-methylase UbiE